MTKNIGITCDDWKIEKFRKRLLEKGFTLNFDGKLTKDGSVHMFTVKCTDSEYPETLQKLNTILKQLEIECKQSN